MDELQNPPDRGAPRVGWDFEVAENEADDSLSAADENGFAGGLLTQPCDESIHSYDPKELLESHKIVQPQFVKSPQNSPHKSSASNAADIRSLLNGDIEPDSITKTQSKRLFADMGNDNEDVNGSSSGSNEPESSDDSSIEENKELTPIQVRRARNIERHIAYAKSLNLGKLGNENGSKSSGIIKLQPKTGQNDMSEEGVNDLDAAPKKKRGMLFSTRESTKRQRQLSRPLHSSSNSVMSTKSAVRELEAKYPGRSMQIKLLSSELEKAVRHTKISWHSKSVSGKHYSEAKPCDDVSFASPVPILISGCGGTGKTSVVSDTINMLREKIDNVSKRKSKSQMCKTNIISHAYVNCASAAGIDVAYVLNSAYRQLYECYHPKSKYSCKHKDFSLQDEVVDKLVLPDNVASLRDINSLGDGECDGEERESDCEEEQIGAEDMIERERKQYRKRNKDRKRQSFDTTKKAAGSEPNERSIRFSRDARQSSATNDVTDLAGTDIKLSSRLNYDSSPVALFGRAVSILLQGGLSRKKPKYGRLAVLVLDNAERVKAWSKYGSQNALAQLFKLPNVLGINLTCIFISRDSLLASSGEFTASAAAAAAPICNSLIPCRPGVTSFKSPGMISDASHPLNIHFDSYKNVDTMKKASIDCLFSSGSKSCAAHIHLFYPFQIFQTSRIQQMITGQSYSDCCKALFPSLQSAELKLKDILYKSMIHSFLQVADSYISDISEIMRLCRMLWSEFIDVFNNQEKNKEYQELSRELMCHLRGENDQSYHRCAGGDCSLCSDKNNSNSKIKSNNAKGKLLEKLDHNIRESVRDMLANVLMMPGRVIEKICSKPYAERLPYITKFVLLAAFLCQQKRGDQDVNLFTTINAGRRSNRGAKTSNDGTNYATSSSDLRQIRLAKIPSFQIERLLSVFTSIMGQYGRACRQACKVGDMGTEELFKVISSLIAGGLLRSASNSSGNRSSDRTDFILEKVTCNLSKEDAQVIASSVGFPLNKYCL